MSEIIKFPSKKVRDWIGIEEGILSMLRENGVNTEAQKELLANMKDFYELLHMDFEFSIFGDNTATIKSDMERLSAALQDRSNRLAVDRFNREIEILRLRGLI